MVHVSYGTGLFAFAFIFLFDIRVDGATIWDDQVVYGNGKMYWVFVETKLNYMQNTHPVKYTPIFNNLTQRHTQEGVGAKKYRKNRIMSAIFA